MNLKLVNHASLLIEAGNVRILTDPWPSGKIFDNGWSLIEESNLPEDHEYNYVWVSHEHPDHFTPWVFALKRIKSNKKILLQKRDDDHKLKNFFLSKGHEVIEITNDGIEVEGVMIKGGTNKSFDSWLSTTFNDITILNLNDCVAFHSKEEIQDIKNIVGNIDVLATQFSFANWTGNIGDNELPMKARKETFRSLKDIFDVLQPKEIIPFANFSYFSHEENHYLNKNSISIRNLIDEFPNETFHVLRKLDTWSKDTTNKENDMRCLYWENKTKHAMSKEKTKTNTVQLEELFSEFYKMKTSLLVRNNLGRLRNELIWHQAYSSSSIYLQDLDVSIDYNIFEDIKVIKKDKSDCDVSMSSESLYNVMKNMWGFGTLMINGRFQANYKTFNNFVLQTRLYYMNNIGKFFPKNVTVRDIKNSNSLVKQLLELE